MSMVSVLKKVCQNIMLMIVYARERERERCLRMICGIKETKNTTDRWRKGREDGQRELAYSDS